jgi:hypothetical protein
LFKERLINAFGCAEMVARTLRKPSGLAHGANFALPRPRLRWHARFRADPSSCHQPSSDQEEVSGREEGEELGAVLGQ